MNTLASAGLLLLTLPLLESRGAAVPVSQEWSSGFDGEDATLATWTIAETRPTARLATWEIVSDPSAPSAPNVLALTRTENEDATFNLAIADDTEFKDLTLSVAVQANSGGIDLGGGPIWRCRDANNYYVCRFNPLESNFRLYFVKDGQRRQLDTAQVETFPGQWYEVGVRMRGAHIVCSLDGRDLLEATDRTFEGAGKIGLWTKSDAATRFDELRVEGPRPDAKAVLTHLKTMELPALRGDLPACTFDPRSGRLFLATPETESILVLDPSSGKTIGSIPGLKRPLSLLVPPAVGRLYVTCGDDSLVAIDTTSLETYLRVELDAKPGRVRWDPTRETLLVASSDRTLTEFRADDLSVTRRLALPSGPAEFVLDAESRHACVHLPGDEILCLLDLQSGRIVQRISPRLRKLTRNTPLALDSGHDLLFLPTYSLSSLVAVTMDDGKIAASTDHTAGIDTLLFDEDRERLVVLGEHGEIEVFSVNPESGFSRLGQAWISPGGREFAWDRATRRLFLATPRRKSGPAKLEVFRLD